jgi:hypothetical protein
MTEKTEIQVAALEAKANQIEAMAKAPSALEAYWAGSATASLVHHYRRGAVRTVKARGARAPSVPSIPFQNRG